MNCFDRLNAFDDAFPVALLEQFDILLLPASENRGITRLRKDMLIELHEHVHQVSGAVLSHSRACHFRLIDDFVSQLYGAQFSGDLEQILVDFTEVWLIIPAQPTCHKAVTKLQRLPEFEKVRLGRVDLEDHFLDQFPVYS